MNNEHKYQMYARLLSDSRSRGETEESPGVRERRSHPRIKADAADLVVGEERWVFVINASVKGMAFYSDEAYEIGQQLELRSPRGPLVKASVVKVLEEDSGMAAMIGGYRINCEIADEEQGMALLLEMKKLEETPF